MLITDREFWHMRMMEDDYEVELWNPTSITFYHKSPDARYISDSNWVGKTDMMTPSDVIDKYGYLMTEEQLEALEAIYPIRAAGYTIGGYQNDGSPFMMLLNLMNGILKDLLLHMRQYTSFMGDELLLQMEVILVNQITFTR